MKASKKLVAAIIAAVLMVAGVALDVDLSVLSGALTDLSCSLVVECVTE